MACKHFYQNAKDTVLKQGPYKGKTLFAQLDEVFKARVDFTNPATTQAQPRLFVAADHLITKLRHVEGGPEMIVDILLLMVPTLEPVGKCPLIPLGVNGGSDILPLGHLLCSRLLDKIDFEFRQSFSKRDSHHSLVFLIFEFVFEN